VEFALGGLQGQSCFLDSLQYRSDVFPVVFQVLQKYEDIVQICHTEEIEVFAQDFVHPSLEQGWCVGQPERHDTVLVKAVSGAERCFPLVSGPNPEVVIGVLDVKLSVDGGAG